MGVYINPPDCTKEAWLSRHGIPLPAAPREFEDDFGVAVCLVDNGYFTAAGVAHSPEELAVFAASDPRPKSWYRVPLEKLTVDVVSPSGYRVLHQGRATAEQP